MACFSVHCAGRYVTMEMLVREAGAEAGVGGRGADVGGRAGIQLVVRV